MKSKFSKVVAAAALIGAFAPAHAGEVSISYNFVDGNSFQANVYGDVVNGNLVDISSIQASYDGTPLAGGAQLYSAYYQPDGSLVAGVGQFSSNWANDNFLIADQSDPNSTAITEEIGVFQSGGTTTFAYSNFNPLTGFTDADTFLNDGAGDVYSSEANGSFVVSQGLQPDGSVTVVPEPSILALVALGLAGMLWTRRRTLSNGQK